MKRVFLYITLALTLLTTSQCSEDLLDLPYYGVQSNKTFYKTDKQIEEALTGTYLQLRTTWDEWVKYHYFIGDISTDDAFKGANDSDILELAHLSDFNVQPTNGITFRMWQICYNLIARANEVIAYAPEAEGDKELLGRYVNEAKLLRAFGYFNLVTLYGGVPITTTPLTPSESLNLLRSTSDEVFQQIVIDLTDATQLPSKSEYDEANQYRVTKGLAYSLLGKSYMFQKKFMEAEEALSEVISVY